MEKAGERVRIGLGQFGDMEQAIVNVAVIRNQMRADELELAASETREDFALRSDNGAQMEDLLFDLNNFVEGLLRRVLNDRAFQIGNFERQLIEGGFVILYNAVQKRMGHAIGSPCNMDGSFEALVLGSLDAPERD